VRITGAAERVRDEFFKEHKQALFLSNYYIEKGEFFVYFDLFYSQLGYKKAFSSILMNF